VRWNWVFGILVTLFVILTLTLVGFKINQKKKVSSFVQDLSGLKTIQLTSSAFQNNQTIPREYTCNGKNTNPPLTIKGVPSGTISLVLIVDDPDAPRKVWSHWVVWNLPKETDLIAPGVLPSKAVVGQNDFKNQRYDGPCPPSGTHHYHFKIYALNSWLNLDSRATREDLEKAIEGKILGWGELIGTYR